MDTSTSALEASEVEPLLSLTDHRPDGIDLVTVTFPTFLSHEQARRYEAHLRTAAPALRDVQLLILDGGAELQIHRPLSSEILEEVKALRKLVDELVAEKRSSLSSVLRAS